jgi:hypothetical protein
VQGVVVDPSDRLWILDTGVQNFAQPLPGYAKMLAIDLATNKVIKTIIFSPTTVTPTT